MRVTKVCGAISASGLFLVLLACGSSGETESSEPEETTEAASESGGDPFGLVGAINRDLERASGEMGEAVEQANQEMAEGAAQAGEATEQAEEAMRQAGQETEAAVEEAAAQ